jgi:hypothetical protein
LQVICRLSEIGKSSSFFRGSISVVKGRIFVLSIPSLSKDENFRRFEAAFIGFLQLEAEKSEKQPCHASASAIFKRE